MTRRSTRDPFPVIHCIIVPAALLVVALAATSARANEVAIAVSARQYAVLYEGPAGKNLSISNVTINSNVGLAGAGVVAFSGPGTISGRLDLSEANGRHFKNANGSTAHTDGRFLGGDRRDMQTVSGYGTAAPTTVVPEPATLALLGASVLGLASFLRRRK